MMRLTFKSAWEQVSMGGGDHPFIRLLELKGFEYIAPEVTAVTYTGIPGRTVTAEQYSTRTITLSGEIINNGEAERRAAPLRAALSGIGTLTIRKNSINRRIGYRAVNFEITSRTRRHWTFAAQVICDDPRFYDVTETRIDLYTTVKYLKTQFTLPMVFSERINHKTIRNAGHINAEPVIDLYFNEDSNGAEQDIRIYNDTTGAMIHLTKAIVQGEVLTVDIPNREIRSSLQDDPLYCISEDTYLSDFLLVPGSNELRTETAAKNVTVVCRYYNQYMYF